MVTISTGMGWDGLEWEWSWARLTKLGKSGFNLVLVLLGAFATRLRYLGEGRTEATVADRCLSGLHAGT